MAAKFRNRNAAAKVDTVDIEPSTPTEHLAKSAVILPSMDYNILATHTASRADHTEKLLTTKLNVPLVPNRTMPMRHMA